MWNCDSLIRAARGTKRASLWHRLASYTGAYADDGCRKTNPSILADKGALVNYKKYFCMIPLALLDVFCIDGLLARQDRLGDIDEKACTTGSSNGAEKIK